MVNFMKKSIIAATLFVLTAPICAQQAEDTGAPTNQAIGEWLRSMAEQQLNTVKSTNRTKNPATSDKWAFPKEPGVHIYSIKDYPAPDPVKESILHGAEMSKRDAVTVPPERVLTEAAARSKLATWISQPLDALEKSLTFAPAELSATPLSTGKLLDAGTVGSTLSNGLSTGFTRTYQVPGAGIITFDEVDYPSSPHLQILLAEESFNTDIDGTPAIAGAIRTTDGRGSASLRWITPLRSYRLTLITDNGTHIEQGQQLLKTIASQMVETK
jgi:hypothetical protein